MIASLARFRMLCIPAMPNPRVLIPDVATRIDGTQQLAQHDQVPSAGLGSQNLRGLLDGREGELLLFLDCSCSSKKLRLKELMLRIGGCEHTEEVPK